MANIIKAPSKEYDKYNFSVFLAGSIDMGAAVNWQEQVQNGLADLPINIFNPRRDDWDSTWEQSITNAKFNEQVTWELDHMIRANVIVFYFDPKGQAPITLLELGLHRHDEIVVCCPEGYWRKGNVDVVCDYYGIPQVKNVHEMTKWIRKSYERYVD